MSAEAALSYASIILADQEADITADSLLAITKAAGTTVDPYWAEVFAKALEGKNLKELLFSFAASAPASGAGAAASSGAAAGGATEEAAAEEVEEEKEESDDDMGFGLFD
ncbi:RPP1B [Candida pseudojiufengensis]|uniref:RPP1B n=1 Tax=Candida pseudojiufengensis TaxID=497109 RepID=UPI0022254EBC|nr:RPP1B [Candida pseudojiufengensis]KAI5959820.1 RPP1B [Candida pseudojiufengensis]